MDLPQKKRIGVMGGTFDPIHYGHLFIAECSRFKFALDKVLFIPTGQPVHKKRNGILEPARRVEMTSLAIKSNPYFELSTIEVDRPGPTYTVDTLYELRSKSYQFEDLYFITGADAILEILTWKGLDAIFEMCRFIAVTRPGYSFNAMNMVLAKLSDPHKDRISFYQTHGILTSSTEIRHRISRGEPIKYLVPEGVEKYIESNFLYRKI